jgi:hypothetical protein
MARAEELLPLIWEKRTARLAAQKLLDIMEADEKAMMKEVMTDLQSYGSEAINYCGLIFCIIPTTEPEVTDWQTLRAHILATGELDLLQKRLLVSAAKARWEEGNDVPGVERVEGYRTTISQSKE